MPLLGVIEEPLEVDCDVPSKPIDRRLVLSKLGGRPGWLSPDCIPEAEQLECRKCGNALMFFLQLYAPFPETEPEDGPRFHRMLYLFGCWTCGKDVRLVRCHLPRANPWLPESIDEQTEEAEDKVLPLIESKCCSLCLLPSAGGSEHLRCRNARDHNTCGSTFPEKLIEIYSEETEAPNREEDIDARLNRALQSGPQISEVIDEEDGGAAEQEEDDDDEPVGGTALDAEQDVFLGRYLEYYQSHIDHVVRYGAEKPMWFSQHHRLGGEPPNCEYCGSHRRFEFQVQSVFADYVGQNANLALAFGILAIYTCASDCDTEGHYRFDYVYRQPDTTLDQAVVKAL